MLERAAELILVARNRVDVHGIFGSYRFPHERFAHAFKLHIEKLRQDLGTFLYSLYSSFICVCEFLSKNIIPNYLTNFLITFD